MAGLCAPLPTLRHSPRGLRRTARGRCGLLLLHRGGLSPPTPCRFRRRTRNLLAPHPLQTVADFNQRQIRFAPMQPQQIISMRLDAPRSLVAAHRQRRTASALAQSRHPPDRAGETHPEPLRRRPATHALLANRRNHPLAQIHRQWPHPAPPPIRRTSRIRFPSPWKYQTIQPGRKPL